ncbi:Necrosis inducing protein [Phytophthora cactorum]|nr:Necrosis inducing protein [Phytophthora cactorum]
MTGRALLCGLTIPTWRRQDCRGLHVQVRHGYYKELKTWASNFAVPDYLGLSVFELASWDGEYQDLIMLEQLTDAARVALNDRNNFGKAEVPFSDEHYEDHLDKAWPF